MNYTRSANIAPTSSEPPKDLRQPLTEVRARIIDRSRSKNGILGLAFGGIRHRIVGSCREKHLILDEETKKIFEGFNSRQHQQACSGNRIFRATA
jgi:hypothetical protein